MRAFFQGWRRKVGWGTLLMAICLSGAWLRSLIREDNLHTPFLALHIHCGTVAWFNSQDAGWRWDAKEIGAHNWTGFAGIWRWTKDVIAVPYWVFIVSLAIASICLLLWSLRRAN